MTVDPLLLIILIALGLALVFVIVVVVLRNLARRKEVSVRERFPNARRVDRSANFFGQESHGVTQMRGTGVLVLTDSELFFEMWVTDKQFRIPLSQIRSIEKPMSFLSKSRFTPLLKVAYLDAQGNPDAAAWQVADVDGWIRLIDEARGTVQQG